MANNTNMGSTMPNQNQQQYSRQETMNTLGIRSRATLTDYCNKLGFPAGLHYFTEEEFAELQEFRSWCQRGGRKADYLRTRRKATPVSWSTHRSYLQSTSA